ncbi:MAG: SAM-dependent chlorinase/fluorinase [Anaerolineales bacterium]|nr:SAM-dependent chlorinase/fluorinase [Anaerolineales bacterium]
MKTISLITDFGLKDGNVGVMKGVIWSIAPQAQISDVSHLIGPQNVREAALILLRSAPYFPPGSIHVVVVDPGVGTARRPMAALLGDQYYVGPDNGVISMWLERAESQGLATLFVHLDRPQYWLKEVSHVFHGRDIFAPCAAHLAAGAPLESLGSPIDDPLRLELPRPMRAENGWRGEVIHLDHFGNISTNLRQEQLQGQNIATVRLRGVNINGLVRTFGERPPGELVALFGSTGNLIICVVNGNAAQRLGAQVGDNVEASIE